ncbi:phytanoyl-CoA dioxygenase family protein [Hyphobacterium sp.]|uniref:phytanoyl-CoA dioxygenase family protein n=1 Tax=Hyphobacterium sp. TaxID=2004662 RepID=UPI003BAB69DC
MRAPCQSCGSSFEEAYSAFDLPLNQTASIEVCTGCGLAQRNPPVAFDFTNLGAEHFMDDWKALELSGLSFKYERLMDAARELTPWVVKTGPWDKHLLDVGSGPGYFLFHARAHGWKVQGVDNWREIAAWGQKHLNIPVEPNRIEDSQLEDGAFEAVTALDVISFTNNPVTFLKACRAKLKPGGLLMISTPNYAAKGREEMGPDWPHLSANVRRWFFTPDSLSRAAKAAGFGASRVRLAGPGEEELIFFAQNPFKASISWDDIAEEAPSDNMLPPLDRKQVDETLLTNEQKFWRENGYLILRKFIPDDVVDAYCRVREKISAPGGWDDETPYMEIKEIRDLCLYGPLAKTLHSLIGEEMVMNLNLTGWKTTQRDWHQDDYLNPDEVRGRYVACWFALDTITADSGPFQFVPGSHQWPHIKKSKILNFVPDEVRETRAWPIHSERVLTPFFEEIIDREKLETVEFTAEKGDVLIWHARLLHRGTVARNPDRLRKAIISHYTALDAMKHYGAVERWDTGGLYFVEPRKREADPQRVVELV